MKKKTKISLIILAVILLLLILPDIAVRTIPSRARRALPESATDIHEEWKGCVIYDHLHLLKARLPEEDYLKYIKNYGLNVKYDPNIHGPKYDYLNMGIGDSPKWWDEPKELDNCYFEHTPGKEYLVRAKWRDGWVYFVVVKW